MQRTQSPSWCYWNPPCREQRSTATLPHGASCRVRRRYRRALPRRFCARAWLSWCGSWHKRGRRGGKPTARKCRGRKHISPPLLPPAASPIPARSSAPQVFLSSSLSHFSVFFSFHLAAVDNTTAFFFPSCLSSHTPLPSQCLPPASAVQASQRSWGISDGAGDIT